MHCAKRRTAISSVGPSVGPIGGTRKNPFKGFHHQRIELPAGLFVMI